MSMSSAKSNGYVIGYGWTMDEQGDSIGEVSFSVLRYFCFGLLLQKDSDGVVD